MYESFRSGLVKSPCYKPWINHCKSCILLFRSEISTFSLLSCQYSRISFNLKTTEACMYINYTWVEVLHLITRRVHGCAYTTGKVTGGRCISGREWKAVTQNTVFHRNAFFALIGPLQDPVTWYGINYAGTQMTQWDFQNKGKSGWTGTSSFVLEVPLRHLRPSVIYSVPCDRILQRAYSTLDSVI